MKNSSSNDFLSKKRERMNYQNDSIPPNLSINDFYPEINYHSTTTQNIINFNINNLNTNSAPISNSSLNINQDIQKNPKELPIYKVKDKIINSINNNRVTIITGNTGCGKTTQVPQIIYEYNKLNSNNVKILITQPRRIAVLNIAERLCYEMGCKKGELVGYHYPLSEIIMSKKTEIMVVTTGIFLEELIHDETRIYKYTHIILDEVHERDQQIDLVMFLVKLHLKKNPNMKLILMSATISSLEFSNYFSESSINELNEYKLCVPKEQSTNFKNEMENIDEYEPQDDNRNKISDKIDILNEANREYNEDKKELYLPSFNEMEDLDWDNSIVQNTEYVKKINIIKKQEDSAPIITVPSEASKCYEYFVDEILKIILKDIENNNQTSDEFYNKYKDFFFRPKNSSPEIYQFMLDICYKLIEWIQNGFIKKNPNDEDTSQDAILIFLPGAAQIYQVKNYISSKMNKAIWENDFLPIILHSEIEEIEQRKLFQSSGNKRKIIFATNIAESSITIDNITYVIDFCLTKQLQYMYYCQREMLVMKWACKASLNQRKGRAGRTKVGYAFRLIPRNFYNTLEENFSPEICRVKLDHIILKLKLYEINNFKKITKSLTFEPKIALQKLMDPPRMTRIISSIISLKFNGALELGPQFIEREKIICGDLIELGRIYAELPCSIIYSKLIMMTYAIGMLDIGIVIGAILHVDKKLFHKTKNNKYILNFYKALEYFSDNQNCDFVLVYNVYREWFNKFGIKLINNIRQRKLYNLSKKEKKEEEKFCEEHQLNSRILREILKNVNDFKLRLIKLNIYTKNELNEENLEIPSQLRKIPNYDIFKYVIYGAFYKNLFIAEYENPDEINKLLIQQANDINPNEILRFPLSNNDNIPQGLL